MANQSKYGIKKREKNRRTDEEGIVYSVGRGSRKSSRALCTLRPGSGKILVNNREFTEYFEVHSMRFKVALPLSLTNTACEFDISLKVFGGGNQGQSTACQMAVAKVGKCSLGSHLL